VRKNYETLLQEVQSLEARKIELQKEIEELQKDPLAVEKEAREKLWLLKPEEKVIVKKKEEKR
jgi:cell division protein FtsB